MGASSHPCDLSRNELAAEALHSFGELRLRVTGSSMLPAVRPDDVLLIGRCGIQEVNPGDIVLFIRGRRLFAHRVKSRSGLALVTQGDSVAEPDHPVTADELLGRAAARILRRGKIIRYGPRPNLLSRVAAHVFRRSAMAGRIFVCLQRMQSRFSL